jgi:hypothetical protein
MVITLETGKGTQNRFKYYKDIYIYISDHLKRFHALAISRRLLMNVSSISSA